jgi:hypothetical protein
MKVSIESTDNGFVVVGPNPNDEGEVKMVFEQSDNPGNCPVGALIRAFWAIKDLLGEYGDKYSQHVVAIGCEAGRGVDQTEPCLYRRDS